jgi:hypothetical protein
LMPAVPTNIPMPGFCAAETPSVSAPTLKFQRQAALVADKPMGEACRER